MFLINNSLRNPSSATGDNPFTDYALPDWAAGLPESQGAPLAPRVFPPAEVFGGDGEFDLLAESTASTGEGSSGSIVLGSIDPLTGAIGSSGGGFEDGLSGLPPTPDPFEGVPVATTMAMGEETSDTLLWCWLPPLETLPAPTEEPPTTEEPLMGGVDPWFPDRTDINSCYVVDERLWVGQLPWTDEVPSIDGEQPPIDTSDPLVTDPLATVDSEKYFTESVDIGVLIDPDEYSFGGSCPDASDVFVTLDEPFVDSSSARNDSIDSVLEPQDETYSEDSVFTPYASYSYVSYSYTHNIVCEIKPIEMVSSLPEGGSSEPPLGDQPLNPQPPEISEPISEGTSPVDSEGSTVLPDPGVPTPVLIQPIGPSSDLPDPLSEEPGISDPLVNTTIPDPIKKPFPIGDDFVITTMALGEEGDAGCWPPLETPFELDPESPFSNVYPVDEVGFDPTADPCDNQPSETYANPTFTNPQPTDLDGLTSDPIGVGVETLEGSQQQERSIEDPTNESGQPFTQDYQPLLIYCLVDYIQILPPLEIVVSPSVLLDSHDGLEPLPSDSELIAPPDDEYATMPVPGDVELEPWIFESESEDVHSFDYSIDASSAAVLDTDIPELDTDVPLSETPFERPRVILPWYRTSVIVAPSLPTEPSLINPVVDFSGPSDSVVYSADDPADGSSQDSRNSSIGTASSASCQVDLAASMTGSSGLEAIRKESSAAPSAEVTLAPSSSVSPAAAAASLERLSESVAAAFFEGLSDSAADSSLSAAQPEDPLSAVPLDRTPQDLPPIALASSPTTAGLTSESAAASSSDVQPSSNDAPHPEVDKSVVMLLLESDRKAPNPLESFQLPLLSSSS